MSRSAPIAMRVCLAVPLIATSACNHTLSVSHVHHSSYSVVDTAKDIGLEVIIAPYRDVMSREMDQVVAIAAQDLPLSKPESPLGNLVAHIIYASAEGYFGRSPDFALQNYGGLRIPLLAAGEIAQGRVYELMPFENYIVLMHLEGGTVLQLIQHMAAKGGWPVEGLRYEIEDGRPVNIEIGGEPFQSRRMYAVAMPDYIANGGDDCSFLVGLMRDESNILIRDAIQLHLALIHENGEEVTSMTDGRVRNAE